ncbi:MAG: CPBP family glutamic-type intramembrane protease [Bacteroidota bacterium]
MKDKVRNIIALAIIIVPFYFVVIFEKSRGITDISIKGLFIKYLLISIFGIIVIYLTNKILLRQNLQSFFKRKEKFIVDLSLGLLLLSATYFIMSLGNITYFRWFTSQFDNSKIIETLKEIFSNKLYAFILLGPFIWATELFSVFSRAFILNNLWKLSGSKIGIWLSIILTALLFAFTQIDKGVPEMINTFLIIVTSNFLYFKYRSITPLLIAPILIQTIDLVAFWFYIS